MLLSSWIVRSSQRWLTTASSIWLVKRDLLMYQPTSSTRQPLHLFSLLEVNWIGPYDVKQPSFLGNCPLASETRRMSEIKRFSAYSDHMTVGLIRGANFPKPVSVNYQEEWKRGLVSEFLAIQLLCIPQVTVETIQRDITEWELNNSTRKLKIV